MTVYMFDKCDEKALENLETITALWCIDKVDTPYEGFKQWYGKSNHSVISLIYRADDPLPVLLNLDHDKSHLNNQNIKHLVMDLMYALDVNKAYNGNKEPCDMNEFQDD